MVALAEDALLDGIVPGEAPLVVWENEYGSEPSARLVPREVREASRGSLGSFGDEKMSPPG